MFSPEGRLNFSIEAARHASAVVAERRCADYFLADQLVVDSEVHELQGQHWVARELILSGLRMRQYQALVLFGDQLTSFGKQAHLAACRGGIKVFMLGVGSGTFGRRYRAWYRPRWKLSAANDTVVAVEEAERLGINIC